MGILTLNSRSRITGSNGKIWNSDIRNSIQKREEKEK